MRQHSRSCKAAKRALQKQSKSKATPATHHLATKYTIGKHAACHEAAQLSPTTINVLGAEYARCNAAVNDNYLVIDIEELRVSLPLCENVLHDAF